MTVELANRPDTRAATARRALAIQLIINHELGLNYNENSLQGSFISEELSDRVEEAVYEEFTLLSQRGGVLGAMETLYQLMKIQTRKPVLRVPQTERRLSAHRGG